MDQNDIKSSLRELGFSSGEIKAYLALTALGEAPASKIAKKADLPRTTVIGLLQGLAAKKYLSAHQHKGVTYFWVESPRAIKESFQTRIKVAEKLESLLSDLYRSEADFPAAQVLDTKSAIRKFMEATIIGLEKKSVILTIDTPHQGNYARILSEGLGDSLVELKNKKGIITKSLVPFGSFASINPKKISSQSIFIRELPQKIEFKSSLWLTGDQLVLFSGKYPFIVAVRHKLITDSLRSVYDFLWEMSEAKN